MFFSHGTSLGSTEVPPSNAPLPWGGSDRFLGIYYKIMPAGLPPRKKLVFLEIYEKILQNHTEARKGLPSFLAASRLPWEGVCRRPGQSSKAAQGGPMAKGQNKCDIAFGLGAWGEELGFSPKATMFLPLGHLLGRQECPQAMPHRCGEALIIIWEFIPKICRKIAFSWN